MKNFDVFAKIPLVFGVTAQDRDNAIDKVESMLLDKNANLLKFQDGNVEINLVEEVSTKRNSMILESEDNGTYLHNDLISDLLHEFEDAVDFMQTFEDGGDEYFGKEGIKRLDRKLRLLEKLKA